MRGWLVAAFALAATGAAEASTLDDILARGALRVGATGDYPPFSRLEAGGYSGFDIDLAKNLAAALGVKLEIVATSWPTLAADFKTGKFDVGIGGITVTLERARLGFFTAPYLREGKTPIARCADKDKFATLEAIDRPEVVVLVNPGGGNERFDRAHLHAARIEVRPDNTTIFDALARGEGDLMITDASETRYQQKQHAGVLCAIHPDAPFDFGEKAFWAPYDPAFDGFLDQWLHKAREDGEFAAIAARWF